MSEIIYIDQIISWLRTIIKWSIGFSVFIILLGGCLWFYGYNQDPTGNNALFKEVYKIGSGLIASFGTFPVLKIVNKQRKIMIFKYFKNQLQQSIENDTLEDDEIIKIKAIVQKIFEQMLTS